MAVLLVKVRNRMSFIANSSVYIHSTQWFAARLYSERLFIICNYLLEKGEDETRTQRAVPAIVISVPHICLASLVI